MNKTGEENCNTHLLMPTNKIFVRINSSPSSVAPAVRVLLEVEDDEPACACVWALAMGSRYPELVIYSWNNSADFGAI